VLAIGVGDRGDAALERGRVRGGLLELFLALALHVFKFYHHGVLSQTKWKCLSGDPAPRRHCHILRCTKNQQKLCAAQGKPAKIWQESGGIAQRFFNLLETRAA
jgi:hypothetical protein